MHLVKRIVVVAVATLVIPAAFGALVEYQATGTFTNSAFPHLVATGDTYICRLVIEDSQRDYYATTNRAQFSNALASVDFKLGPGANGLYSGGVCNVPLIIETHKGEGVDWIYNFATQGFGSLNGFPFLVSVYLLDYSQTSAIHDS